MQNKRTAGSSLFLVLMLLLLVGGVSHAQTFDNLKNQVKEHTLANGMKFIVLERHEAPVVSFHTYADVGSANETYGITGISHLLEHMAFKGTQIIGTTDYETEAIALARLDSIYTELTREQSKGQRSVLIADEEFSTLPIVDF